jgi:hypothetical protein
VVWKASDKHLLAMRSRSHKYNRNESYGPYNSLLVLHTPTVQKDKEEQECFVPQSSLLWAGARLCVGAISKFYVLIERSRVYDILCNRRFPLVFLV